MSLPSVDRVSHSENKCQMHVGCCIKLTLLATAAFGVLKLDIFMQAHNKAYLVTFEGFCFMCVESVDYILCWEEVKSESSSVEFQQCQKTLSSWIHKGVILRGILIQIHVMIVSCLTAQKFKTLDESAQACFHSKSHKHKIGSCTMVTTLPYNLPGFLLETDEFMK